MQYDLWEYVLTPEDEGKKYQAILSRKFHFSHKVIQHLKQGENVWVNGKFSYLNARGKVGDILAIELHSAEESNIPGENLPLEVLYEDGYLLAVNKPAGQVAHPNPRYQAGTLGNAVIGYWLAKGEERPFRPVHRIDRNTSGVMVIAKNRFAHQQLAWQSEKGKIHKRYLGFVQGNPPEDSGQWDGPIGLVPGSFIQRHVCPDGMPALTYYKVLRRFQNVSLMEFILGSGCTHQIRAHCAGYGFPLLGDTLYGGDPALINRQALHSYVYAFDHPLTGSKIVIKAPLPQDLQELIARTRGQV